MNHNKLRDRGPDKTHTLDTVTEHRDMTERGHETNLREQTSTEHRERSQMRITQYYKLNKEDKRIHTMTLT